MHQFYSLWFSYLSSAECPSISYVGRECGCKLWLQAFISTKTCSDVAWFPTGIEVVCFLSEIEVPRRFPSRKSGYPSLVCSNISGEWDVRLYVTYKLFVSLKVTHFCYRCCTRSTVFPLSSSFFCELICSRMRCGIKLLRNVLYPLERLFANSFRLLHVIQL